MKQAAKILVSGRVQGVFFRATALDVARRLSLTGYVRNLPNGDVEIVAEGDEGALKGLIDWARHGPAHARVDEVRLEWGEASNWFKRFEMR